jgi:DNA primase
MNLDALFKHYKDAVLSLNHLANFYRKSLFYSQKGLDYCSKRGIDSNMIDKFLIGYDPGIVYNKNFFETYQIDPILLEKIGVLKKNNDNVYYSFFSHHLIFPIFDLKGNVIAICGRTLDNSLPKYRMTKTSEIFQKSLSLYGLYQSLNSIIKYRTVFVVEGNVDVISCYKVGIHIVVSPFGTSFMYTHFLLLKTFADYFIFCFDNDDAGRKAKQKVIEMSKRLDNIKLGFLDLEGAKDPDEFIYAHSSHPQILINSIKDMRDQMSLS